MAICLDCVVRVSQVVGCLGLLVIHVELLSSLVSDGVFLDSLISICIPVSVSNSVSASVPVFLLPSIRPSIHPSARASSQPASHPAIQPSSHPASHQSHQRAHPSIHQSIFVLQHPSVASSRTYLSMAPLQSGASQKR